jgi:hypothetical protein
VTLVVSTLAWLVALMLHVLYAPSVWVVSSLDGTQDWGAADWRKRGDTSCVKDAVPAEALSPALGPGVDARSSLVSQRRTKCLVSRSGCGEGVSVACELRKPADSLRHVGHWMGFN